MPADNISQIRAADDAADTALAAQCVAYGVAAFQPRDAEDISDIFALSLFTLGPGGHLFRTPVGGLEYDLWIDCLVSIEIFAPRINDTPASLAGVYDRLGENAARIRHALAPDRLAELNARLPWHKLTRLLPIGEIRGFDEERKIDRHELRYRTALGVKPSAWPTLEAAYTLPAAAT